MSTTTKDAGKPRPTHEPPKPNRSTEPAGDTTLARKPRDPSQTRLSHEPGEAPPPSPPLSTKRPVRARKPKVPGATATADASDITFEPSEKLEDRAGGAITFTPSEKLEERVAVGGPETAGLDTAALLDLCNQGKGLVRAAQRDRCAYDADLSTYQASMAQVMDADVGPLWDVFDQIIALAQAPAPPEPEPVPIPAPLFVAPLPPGAIYGETKWLTGSLGADLFCRRGTVVVAPCDGVIEEVLGGTGLQGGAEVILATRDRSWAFRFRHVQAHVTVGQQVRQGQAVAVVNDASLDRLCLPPVAGFPDRWQHLDLSVDRNGDRFAPTGGGGGNVSSYEWLTQIGYQGQVLRRTPGPTDCGMHAAEAQRLLEPRR